MLPEPLHRVRSAIGARTAQSPRFEAQLTWIFGSPRTGSSWLLRLLAQHPAVAPINEPLIGWYLGPFLCDMPGGNALALDSSNFTLRRVQAGKYSHFFSEAFAEVWVPNLARIMRARFYAEAARLGGSPLRRAVVIQEPNGSQSADLIMRVLPRAKLLFLLRDGRDVVDSELAANLAGSWVSREFPGLSGIGDDERLAFVGQSASKWLWRTEMVQAAMASHTGPACTVRYEDLLADPETQLSQIFRWLELDVSDSDVAYWVEQNEFQRMSGGFTGPAEFFRSARPGAWAQNLRPEEQEVVHKLLGAKLRELGYTQ